MLIYLSLFLEVFSYTFVGLVKRGVLAPVGEIKYTHFQNTKYFIRPTAGD